MSEPLTRKLVQSFNVTEPISRRVDLYDSELNYPLSPGMGNVDITKLATTFHIPSSRYYYLTTQGNPVAYLALAKPEQFFRDVQAWRGHTRNLTRLYNFKQEVASEGPEIDLFNLFNGIPVVGIPRPYGQISLQYINNINEILGGYSDVGQYRSGPRLLRESVQDLIDYPVHPDSNVLEAFNLSTGGTEEDLQNYLNDRGIIHFQAKDIINLPSSDKFWYLTRFYGPVVQGNLTYQEAVRRYRSLARNESAQALVAALPTGGINFAAIPPAFEAYFNEYNQNPDSEAYKGLGAKSLDRFLNRPLDYLALLRRPQNLPLPLTLNTIRQLNARTRNDLIQFLSDYTDFEVESLVGAIDADRRWNMLEFATDRLRENRAFLMFPQEAAACRNEASTVYGEEFSEMTAAYIGVGNLAEGLGCYDIEELIDNFDSNIDSDGFITFRDVLDYQRNFTLEEIKAIHKALETGRPNLPVNPEYVEKFAAYVEQYTLQQSSGFQSIRRLRAYANESPENAQKIRDIWNSYFRTGMYMRQWNGPGHPYPVLETQTGRERGVGSQEELTIAENVNRSNQEFLAVFETLPQELRDEIWQLRVYFVDRGQPVDKRVTIQNRYREVITRGVYCIRMASGPWAYTGAYYLKQILNEDIPGFDLTANLEFVY